MEKNKIALIKVATASIAAAILGLEISGIGVLIHLPPAPFMMMMLFIPVIMMALYGASGFVPPAVFAISLIAGTYFTLGGFWCVGLQIVYGIPGAAMIYLSYRGIPFFKQIRFAMIVQAMSILITMMILYAMYGPNMGGAAADIIRNSVSALTTEQTDFVASHIKEYYEALGFVYPYNSSEEMLANVVNTFEQMLKMSIPMVMVICILINSTCGVLIGNYIRKRRGEENVQFVSVRGWRLPPMLSITIFGALLITAVIRRLGRSETDMIYMLISFGFTAAFTVQATASILSRLSRIGVKKGNRSLICMAFLLFGGSLPVLYGAGSALFGSQGVFMPFIRKRIENKKNDEEDHDI